jgi:hypothetical protein
MMICCRVFTNRFIAALPRKATNAVSCKELSALVSIEDEFPGYVSLRQQLPAMFLPLADFSNYVNLRATKMMSFIIITSC